MKARGARHDLGPHAVLDLPSRRQKALKIERLLKLDGLIGRFSILEIGTGSGGIAHYFSAHDSLNCEVYAVDVNDQRLVAEGYEYQNVKGTKLPFPDEKFDVVITNHVIEHVGGHPAQMEHLCELNRVLKGQGIGYLAVPNRWMLVEPHFRLIFLSWLPERWRSTYVRMAGKGQQYDCRPLQKRQLEAMLAAAGISYTNLCTQALRETLEIERPNSALTKLAGQVPASVWRTLHFIFPTLIYSLRKNERPRRQVIER